MSITFRFFIATEAELTLMSRARWNRLVDGEEPVPHHHNQEAKTIEVTLDVERRVVRRVVRVLPVRMPVDEHGRMRTATLLERAVNRLASFTAPRTIETVIHQLQQDASYFWPLEERHWRRMSQLLDVPIAALKRALHRSPRAW
jgi:hypothetical protein